MWVSSFPMWMSSFPYTVDWTLSFSYWMILNPWRKSFDCIYKGLFLGSVFCPFSSVQFSQSVTSDSLQPHALQLARLPCPSPTPGAYSNSGPLSRWCHPTISSSVVPFSSWFNLSQHQGLFQWVSSSHQVAKVLQLQFQHQSFQWMFRTDFL